MVHLFSGVLLVLLDSDSVVGEYSTLFITFTNAQHLSFKQCNVSVSQGRRSVLFSKIVKSTPVKPVFGGGSLYFIFFEEISC